MQSDAVYQYRAEPAVEHDHLAVTWLISFFSEIFNFRFFLVLLSISHDGTLLRGYEEEADESFKDARPEGSCRRHTDEKQIIRIFRRPDRATQILENEFISRDRHTECWSLMDREASVWKRTEQKCK